MLEDIVYVYCIFGLLVIVKGIQLLEDVEIVIQVGVVGIWVFNYGGC